MFLRWAVKGFYRTAKQVLFYFLYMLMTSPGRFPCPRCDRVYSQHCSMSRHFRLECGVDPQFQCPFCSFQTHRKGNIHRHIAGIHGQRQLAQLRAYVVQRMMANSTDKDYSALLKSIKLSDLGCDEDKKQAFE